MTITIGSNTLSLNAQRHLANNTSSLASLYEKISSGQRINKASDDAAGLAITSSLNADARVFSQSIRNINDGISLLSVAAQALHELASVGIRQKELAIQALNGTYTKEQRLSLHQEVRALTDEWNRIVVSTSFNGQKLLDGDTDSIQIQAGHGTETALNLDLRSQFLRTVGDGTFDAEVIIDVYGSPSHVVGADVNNDGNIDLVATGSAGTVHLGNGDGTFQEAAIFAGSFSLALSTADFDGDGYLDIAFTGWSSSNVQVYRGHGNGTFALSGSYATTEAPDGVTIADFNQDGIPDLVTAERTNRNVSIFFGLGDCEFVSAGVFQTLASGSYRIESADMNNDDIPDLVVGGYGGGVSVHINNGDGSFQQALTYSGLSAISAAVADFNLDGSNDIAAQGSGAIGVRLGNGDGSLSSPLTYATGISSFYSLAAEDLNGDGYADIFGGGYPGSGINVMLNRGDATFNLPVTYASGVGSHTLDAVDLNNDGALDILSGDYSSGWIGYFLGRTTTTGTMPHFNLGSADEARRALAVVDEALARAGAAASTTGASQRRLEVAQEVLLTRREQCLAAAARIKDADIAGEAASLVRFRIGEQAAAAVLAHANQRPQIALQLLTKSS